LGLENQQDADNLVKMMNHVRNTIQTQYPSCGEIPPLTSSCKVGVSDDKSGNSNNSTQPQVNLVYTGYESNAEKFRDEYIKTFGSTKEFNAYASGENAKRVGIAMAKVMSEQLSHIQNLTNNDDPNSLLLEFNQKTKEIDRLKENYNQEFKSYSFNVGIDISNSMTNKDYGNALFQLGGFLNASIEKKKADEELARKKAEMAQSKNSQMQDIYFKTLTYITDLHKKVIKDAAYSEPELLENYHFKVGENLMCQWNFMYQNYSLENTNWLKHNCPNVPNINKQSITSAQKNDVYYSSIASRKFEKFNYKIQGTYDFLDAAIMYASKAIELNPKAKYFVQLADYHHAKGNDILSLGNYLIAESYDKKVLTDLHHSKVKTLKIKIEFEIENIIKQKKFEKIDQLLLLGLDQVILVNNKNLLDYAIINDESELVQIIFNQLKKNTPEKEIDIKYKKTTMLASASNAKKTLNNLYDNGVALDFKLNNRTPIDIAFETYSVDAYNFLIEKYNGSINYKKKHDNKGIRVMQSSDKDIDNAVTLLNNFNDENDLISTISKMIDLLPKKTHYASILGKSNKALNIIHSNNIFKTKLEKDFHDQIIIFPGDNSLAYLYIENNLLKYQHLPTLEEINSKIQSNNIAETKRPTNPLNDAKQIKNAFEEFIPRLKKHKNKFITQEQNNKIISNYETHLNLIQSSIDLFPDENSIRVIDAYVFNIFSESNMYKSYNWGPSIGLDQYFDQFDFLKSNNRELFYMYFENIYRTKEPIDIVQKVKFVHEATQKVKKEGFLIGLNLHDNDYLKTLFLGNVIYFPLDNIHKSSINPQNIKDINGDYSFHAIRFMGKLDEVSLNMLKNKNSMKYRQFEQSYFDDFNYSSTDNLLTIAVKANNKLFFEALDKKYNWTSTNPELLNVLLKQNRLFTSSHYNLNDRINGKSIILNWLDYNGFRVSHEENLLKLDETLEARLLDQLEAIYSQQKFDLNNMMDNGGTFLHWLFENDQCKQAVDGTLVFLGLRQPNWLKTTKFTSKNIDLSKKNVNGETAYTLMTKTQFWSTLNKYEQKYYKSLLK
jgi:hypothetical protein